MMATEYEVMVYARGQFVPAYFTERKQAVEAQNRSRAMAKAKKVAYEYPIRERDVTEWRHSK